MFTSQIPDIDLTTSDDNEAVVMIVSGGTSVFSATHIPFAKSITVHDIRSVIEYYMRQGNHALRGFELRVKHNGAFQSLARETHVARGDGVPVLPQAGLLQGERPPVCRGQRL